MAQQLDDFIIRGINRGMADDGIIADSMMPDSQVRLLVNLDVSRIGSLKSRLGYTQLGSTAVVSGKATLGLHSHVGTNSKLIAFSNNSGATTAEAYYLNGSSWTNKALGFTAGTKIRATTFLDLVCAVNGTDSPKSWTGATGDSWGSTNLASAPIGHIVVPYRQQLMIINTSTDTVYFSSIPTAGAITWPANNNFIVNPNDGSRLTAGIRYAEQFVLFKRNFIYRYNGRSTDADPAIDWGTASQESVVVLKGSVYFYDPIRQTLGAYSGGYPEDVGRAVGKFFAAIPTSSETNVTLRAFGDFVEAFIGTVTVDGRVFTNCALRYNINSKAWTVRVYYNSFAYTTLYDNGTTLRSLMGSSTGVIYQMDYGVLDDAVAIAYEMESQWYTGTPNNPYQKVKAGKVVSFVDSETPVLVEVKTNLNPSWKALGNGKKYVSVYPATNFEYNRVKVRLSGSVKSGTTVIDGFGIIDRELVVMK